MLVKLRSITFFLILFSFSVNAQKHSIKVQGIVVDNSTTKPLSYATIALYEKDTKDLITGGITDAEGKFSVQSSSSNFYVEVSFLGYNSIVINDYEINGQSVYLKTIKVEPNEELLNDVMVTAEKSQTVFELDKRVFNVGQDLISSGGSALDVLNNVPSVNVNIEGVVSLRGNSNVQILINGKPSVLASGNTLGSITADMIEKIEVITNPSAKYDAQGTTGIINIVLKKESKKGFNGSVSFNVGSPRNNNIGLSMNMRTDRFNFFGQFGVGKRSQLSSYNGVTLDRKNVNSNYLYNNGSDGRDEQVYHMVLGTDYYINKLNVITLTGNFAYEIEDNYSNTAYDKIDRSNVLISSSARSEVAEATNPKIQYDLTYKKSFEDNKDKSFIMSATGNSFSKNQFSNFENKGTFGEFDGFKQRFENDYLRAEYVFLADYVHPFTKESELESGIKYVITEISNDYDLMDWESNQFISNPEFNDIFSYDQNILAAYTTYGYKFKKFGVKAGLRVENTKIKSLLEVTNETNDQDYTNLFPSIHSSFKFTETFSVQMGYSRRIGRPDMRDLNPFTSFSDNLNLRTGNPDLIPEFTNSFELSTLRVWGIGTLSGAIYHRRTDGVIDRITTVVDSLTITTPMNLGQSRNTGIELNGSFDPAIWYRLMIDANWSSFHRIGVLESENFDFSNSSWSTEITNKFKFPYDIDLEIRVNYQSAEERVQGIILSYAYADFGVKKKFMKGRAVVNFSMRDVFKSRKYRTEVDLQDFYRYSESMRNPQQVVLGLSYGFGKGDAMEYSGQSRHR
jgi:outer membrane receptor protein involved in Fe transport